MKMRGLEPLFFTFVLSTFATILITRVLRIVAKVLTTVTVGVVERYLVSDNAKKIRLSHDEK